MKTPQQLQAVVDELRAVCERHGVVLIATCESEGIFGEITIADASLAGVDWINAAGRVDNTIHDAASVQCFAVNGIGTVLSAA